MLSIVTPVSSTPPAKPRSHFSTQEFSVTLRPLVNENLGDFFSRLAAVLHGAVILNLLVFGSITAAITASEAMRRMFGRVDWPVTWVEGDACDQHSIAGVQVFGLADGTVQRIRLDGQVVGSVFQDGTARHCLLGGLGPASPLSSRADQTKQVIAKLQTALAQAGFSFADTVRTWFFLENLLSWYDDFNRARTEIYSGIKFRTGSLPGSTGVGGRNPAGAALCMAARAMQPLAAGAFAEEVASPLQCPAPAYGSSFSRAMELSTAAGRQLFISGTASIAPGGETLWQNDVRQQVELTMRVVEAILHSRGFSLADVTRAVAYFKRRVDVDVFTGWCATRGWLSLPVVPAHCDVCRDNLLFELEADAAKSPEAFANTGNSQTLLKENRIAASETGAMSSPTRYSQD